jgi:hypothetical protein
MASKLPIEIVDYIFIVASLKPYLLSSVLNLMRVSRRTCELLRPYLYHTVKLKRKRQADLFLMSISQNPRLCENILEFGAGDICSPFREYHWWTLDSGESSPYWLGSHSKEAPKFETIAEIIRLLLEERIKPPEDPSTPPEPTSTGRALSIHSTIGTTHQMRQGFDLSPSTISFLYHKHGALSP